jgi:hypothetical protein
MTDHSASTRFRDLFDDALRAYENETGVTLANHPLAVKLQACDSVEAITALLQDQAKDFKKSEKITKSIETIVSILTPLSFAASLPDAVGLVCRKVLQTSFTSLTIHYSHSRPRKRYRLVSASYLMYVPFSSSYADILVLTDDPGGQERDFQQGSTRQRARVDRTIRRSSKNIYRDPSFIRNG